MGVDDDDDGKIAESDLENVREEAFYRPKSALLVPLIIDNGDMAALSRALFNSNQMNLFEKTHEIDLLDKETGEKVGVKKNLHFENTHNT